MERTREAYMAIYKQWCENPYFDLETQEELRAIEGNDAEIKERFVQDLSFGTGGLRAERAAGSNRMNLYTISQATEGFARYIDRLGEAAKKRGVAISYDSRIMSPEFALRAALVFAAHGIKVYLSDILRPTPMLSFAVRHFSCVGGVMVTASHNPAKYNGYKAYGEDGGQMPPDAAEIVMDEMSKIDDLSTIQYLSEEEAQAAGLLEYFGEEFDRVYTDMLLGLRINPDMVEKHSDLKIVYTPLHGAGNLPVQRILHESGFKQVFVVPEQEAADGNFPTVPYPNPEERAALELAIQLAERESASLVVATDPDGDRTGLVVRLNNGEYQVLTGNQIGLLLMDYILGAKQKRGILEPKSFCATTIVSTRLAKKVCDYYGVTLFEVLTGFKYIGELMEKLDEHGDMHFQFGFEESYGYLTGLDVRDKDAVVSTMLICELAATLKDEDKTLADRLEELYKCHGYGLEKTISLTFEGLEGMNKIKQCLNSLRADNSFALESSKIQARRDYLSSERFDLASSTTSQLTLPKSNVLLYELEGLDWACVRPSGTEPKLKVYFGAYAPERDSCAKRLEAISTEFEAKLREFL
ncbi:MAG: phospho-sugar mutase [Eubacteriales bacterium]|nr:phospho-sugar mutase [Eubacteriales bacterium]